VQLASRDTDNAVVEQASCMAAPVSFSSFLCLMILPLYLIQDSLRARLLPPLCLMSLVASIRLKSSIVFVARAHLSATTGMLSSGLRFRTCLIMVSNCSSSSCRRFSAPQPCWNDRKHYLKRLDLAGCFVDVECYREQFFGSTYDSHDTRSES